MYFNLFSVDWDDKGFALTLLDFVLGSEVNFSLFSYVNDEQVSIVGVCNFFFYLRGHK